MDKLPILPLMFLMGALLAYGCGEAQEKDQASAAQKPNILFVLTDDMRADELEHIEGFGKLATQGVTFSKAYLTNSECCPSRTTILTGKYSHNTGVLSNVGPDGGYAAYQEHNVGASTVATWLKSTGYKTALFGKFINGYGSKDSPKGFAHYTRVSGTAGDPALGAIAAKWIQSNHNRGPLFVELSVRSPHTPLEVAPQFKDKHRGETFDLAPSFDEEDVSDKPAWIRQLPRLTAGERQALQLRREQRLQTLEGANLAMQRALDAFGRVGERQNTYVVFTSDNGFVLGEHRIQTMKSIPYEESIRAPLIISGPGIPHGVVRDELVTNNDLAPTFAAWANVGAPGVDGRSLIPLLSDNSSTTGEQERWRSALLTENPGQPGEFPGYKAIVTEDYSYVKWSTGERELYDLTSDPYQLENLAGHRPDLEAALGARLDALQDCAGDSCRSAEDT